MDDEKTIIKPRASVGETADSSSGLPLDPDILSVGVLDADGAVIQKFSLSQSFTVGRALDNTIVIDNDGVSRHHIEIRKENGSWRIRNLGSANGVYIDDRLIEDEHELIFPLLVSLGRSGAWLELAKAAETQHVVGASPAGLAAGTPDGTSLDADLAKQQAGMRGKLIADRGDNTAGHTTDPTNLPSSVDPVQRSKGSDGCSPTFAEALSVDVLDGDGRQTATFTITGSFTVGRSAGNTIVIDNRGVSRHHLEVRNGNGNGSWLICNLGSINGVYIDGRLIEHEAELHFPVVVSLGRSGISLKMTEVSTRQAVVATSAPTPSAVAADGRDSRRAPEKARSLAPEDIKVRLLADNEAEDVGDYTRIVRRIIREDRVIRKKSYKKVIGVLGVLFAVSVSMAAYQQIALANTKRLALEMFYDIKALEVSISQADIKLEESAEVLDKAMVAITNERLRIVDDQLNVEREKLAVEKDRMMRERERLAAMKGKYRQYVEEANSLRLRFPTAKRYEEELIAKVTSELGESELELPDDFLAEVRKYIKYWQGSSRMQKAIDNIERNNYLPIVVGALKKHGLPLYFVYLPLQESSYDAQAVGPQTKFGIAKGAWQLLATTAQEYGIATGPLVDAATYDVEDARFDFKVATQAGVKYLKRIYSSEAQASGLLVMASYNYGDTRVRKMIRQMPDNPRERNFWRFVQAYQLPKETHDYVFYILSAAVIGEDPQHFGFNFPPPLRTVDGERKAEKAGPGKSGSR